MVLSMSGSSSPAKRLIRSSKLGHNQTLPTIGLLEINYASHISNVDERMQMRGMQASTLDAELKMTGQIDRDSMSMQKQQCRLDTRAWHRHFALQGIFL